MHGGGIAQIKYEHLPGSDDYVYQQCPVGFAEEVHH